MPRRSRQALIGATAAILLLLLTWFLAFHVGLFEQADQKILTGFVGLDTPRLFPILSWVAHLCDPKPYVFFAAVPVIVALARRRVRVAAAVAATLLGANVTAQLLKPLLAHPRPSSLLHGLAHVAPASWPSGHATAAMALALTSVIAAPPRVRPYVAALGGGFAVAVSYSFLTLEWHYPSDVFGGFLVAAAWTLLAVAAVTASDARQPRGRPGAQAARTLSPREVLLPPALAVSAAIALVGLAAIVRPHAVVAYARAHTTFMVGAPAIALLALAIATALVLVLRREPPVQPQR